MFGTRLLSLSLSDYYRLLLATVRPRVTVRLAVLHAHCLYFVTVRPSTLSAQAVVCLEVISRVVFFIVPTRLVELLDFGRSRTTFFPSKVPSVVLGFRIRAAAS